MVVQQWNACRRGRAPLCTVRSAEKVRISGAPYHVLYTLHYPPAVVFELTIPTGRMAYQEFDRSSFYGVRRAL